MQTAIRAIAAILIASTASLGVYAADDQSRKRDDSGVVFTRMPYSLDETPVKFRIEGAPYKIPRNHLVEMDGDSNGAQEVVVIRLTYPELLPFSKATEECFRNRGVCKTIDIFIGSSHVMAEEEKFAAFQPDFHEREPVSVAPGIEMFTVGPQAAPQKFFRVTRGSKISYFSCIRTARGDGICNSSRINRSWGTTTYRFSERELLVAVALSDKIFDLVDSFSEQRSCAGGVIEHTPTAGTCN